jgi:serine/threonine protein kinase
VTLADAIAASRAAWPGVDVPDDAFAAYVAERVDGRLDAACVTDLYLACAIGRGDAAALRAFELQLEHVAAAIGHLDGGSALVDDVTTAVRERVLGAAAGGKAKIADYRGRGDLRGWLRVIAVREALQLMRARRREAPMPDDLATKLEVEPPSLATEERKVYREAFTAALAKLQPAREPAAPAETETAGTLGRYVLHARLGAGGMGVVYAAYDPELDRRVALKVLRRTRAGEQLREEARAIAKLAHPNVIAVHDVGEADGEVFVAMEHVDGVTLREWLREPRTPSEILDVFVQAGRGLAAAHRAGLVHRDVKPSNIIVGTDGRARVLDFGLARSEQGHEAEVAGTPAYMAPEQRRGERVDARADQYAFSVALWEALGGSREAQKLDGVSDRVSRALRRSRSDDPADRFATMDELLAELAPPPPRRRWMIAAAFGMLAIGVAIALVVLRREEPESCARAGAPIARVWSVETSETLRTAFVATKLPYAAKAAGTAISELDDWAMRWRERAISTCKATVEERFQPPAARALVDECLAQLLDRAKAVIELATKPDAGVVASADTLVRSLPSPDRCFVGELSGVEPPAERDRDEVRALRAEIDALDVALLAGRAQQIHDRVPAIDKRAAELGYVPLRARAHLLVARLESSSAHYDEAIARYHAAARDATTARDRSLLAEIWIELSQALGNDVSKGADAELFDGYAAALIPQLTDTKTYELDLAFARCNRNVTAADAAKIAEHCKTAFAMAWEATPPKRAIAIAARTRLGHFLRLQGQQAEAVKTLREVIESATEFHGAQHPDVAIAHYALGIALIS